MDPALKNVARKIKQIAAQIEGSNGVNGASGSLSGFSLGYVTAKYQELEDTIAELRDPGIDPSLTPPEIGTAISGYSPTLTYEFATDMLTLGDEAYAESQTQSPSHQYVGDRIATISSLMPGFRYVAGLP